MKTHGLQYLNGVRRPEYAAWNQMKNRCYNKSSHNYKNYGGREITVCDRWLKSFESFFTDMGERPSDDHSLDRYPNNNGNYELSNCRWATKKEQNENRRICENSNRKISKMLGGSESLVSARMYNGWPRQLAVSVPKQQ